MDPSAHVPVVKVALLLIGLSAAGCQSLEENGRAYQAPGVPVSLGAIEGAPEAVTARVTDEVAAQAAARRIEIVSTGEAPRYTLRGYLTAYPTESGDTMLAIVWDVFDARKQRAQRVSSTAVAKGQSTDPWSRIGEPQIAKATSQSMNQVAAFLSGESTAATTSVGKIAPAAHAMGFAGGQ